MMAKADYRLPDETRERVSKLIAEKSLGGQGGATRVAKLLGVSPITLKCAVAGLEIQPGTGALIEKRLGEREARKSGLAGEAAK